MLTPTIPAHDTSSPKHMKPVLFVADADPELRRGLTAALKHRFGTDYHVRSAAMPGTAMKTLRRLHDEAAEGRRLPSPPLTPT
jgi:hypothetical protein